MKAPLKVMYMLTDQLSLFKVRMFIKSDGLTGRYFEVLPLALTFRKKAALDSPFGTSSCEMINIPCDCSSSSPIRAVISISRQQRDESQAEADVTQAAFSELVVRVFQASFPLIFLSISFL